jgi:hypothetical protein
MNGPKRLTAGNCPAAVSTREFDRTANANATPTQRQRNANATPTQRRRNEARSGGGREEQRGQSPSGSAIKPIESLIERRYNRGHPKAA